MLATAYRKAESGLATHPIAVAIESVRVWGLHSEVLTVDVVAVPVWGRGRDAEVRIGG